VRIRLFQPEDTDSVAELLREMSCHYNGANASSLEVVRANLVTNILGTHSGVRLVVAIIHRRVVGVATVSLLYPAPKERAQLFMKELYVLSAERGAGIGTKMMHWLAQYAVQNNCARFDWTVDESNVEATRFYRSLGAKHVKDKLYFRFTGEELQAFAGS
jgi:GNAT superfamily N-acetyltransferase